MRTSRTLTFFGLAGALVLTAAASLQETFVLRRELKADTSDAYVVEFKSDNTMESPMGPMDMGVVGSMLQTYKVGKVDSQKGVAELEMVTSDMKFELTGPMAQMAGDMQANTPKEVAVKGELDTRNRVKATAASLDPRLMMMMGPGASAMGSGLEFPEGAVKIGDSWEVAIPKNPFLGDVEHKLKATLTGQKDVDGKSAWTIDIEGAIPFDVDMQELMKKLPAGTVPNADAMAGMRVLLKGQIDLKSAALVEKSSGKLLKMETSMATKQTVNLPDMGMAMNGTGMMTMKIGLKPAG